MEIEFDQFYKLYPRREAGAKARIMWNRLTDEEKQLAFAALPNHIALWKAENRERQHIPLPASWLNPVLGRRWEDEIELPKAKEPDWFNSEAGVLKKGEEVGLLPRPGESLFEYKARINEKIKKVAA